MKYQVQRYDCSEWWTFQTTDNYVTAVYLRDNAYSGVMTRIVSE